MLGPTLYLSRRMARRPVFEFVPSTLQAAFARFEGAVGMIVHSDQGRQYKSGRIWGMLTRSGVTQSMSRKGDCFDNAAIESFATLRARSAAGPASISRNQRLMFGYVLLAKPLSFCNH